MFFVIAFLILLGIVLLVVEFVVIPGITVAGIGGFLLLLGGVFLSYKTYGFSTGNYTLISTIIILAIAFYYSFKSRTWDKITIHAEIDSKVNVINGNNTIHVGDTGKAIGRLAPMGKVMINGHIYEAKSTGYYIEEATDVEIIKINESNITVKPLKL